MACGILLQNPTAISHLRRLKSQLAVKVHTMSCLSSPGIELTVAEAPAKIIAYGGPGPFTRRSGNTLHGHDAAGKAAKLCEMMLWHLQDIE